ncbi:MAG: fumarate hydratase [Candidatus Omnitrophica bacterium]|nr:fumarate hydratase [Candidatus Omnitrophota bacterium]
MKKAVNDGVKTAYAEGYFRKSVVADPIKRKNTGTNTPCVIHFDFIAGDKIKISVLPKGFGAENKGRISMMNPTAGGGEIIDFCVETIKRAGCDACPPYVVGVGIGGTIEECALLAKEALLRPINKRNTEKHIASIEKEIFKKANGLKIGVMGLGGNSTVLGVNIETGPTHIAGLPVAVNLSCHAMRSASGVV